MIQDSPGIRVVAAVVLFSYMIFSIGSSTLKASRCAEKYGRGNYSLDMTDRGRLICVPGGDRFYRSTWVKVAASIAVPVVAWLLGWWTRVSWEKLDKEKWREKLL